MKANARKMRSVGICSRCLPEIEYMSGGGIAGRIATLHFTEKINVPNVRNNGRLKKWKKGIVKTFVEPLRMNATLQKAIPTKGRQIANVRFSLIQNECSNVFTAALWGIRTDGGQMSM